MGNCLECNCRGKVLSQGVPPVVQSFHLAEELLLLKMEIFSKPQVAFF